MKRFLIFLFLFLILGATTTFAEIKIRKSTFARFKSGSTQSPQIAANTNTGESLVVWFNSIFTDPATHENDHLNFIFGRLIDANGRSKSAVLKLVSDIWAFNPTVAYNPIRNEYLLVWDDRDGDSPRFILGQRLNSAGKPIGDRIEISTATSRHTAKWLPRVVFNPSTGGYSVIWQDIPDNREESKQSILGVSVSDVGEVGKTFSIQKTTQKSLALVPLDLAYHSPSGKLLLTYFKVGTDFTENYYLATLDAQLKSAPVFKKINRGAFTGGNEGASIALQDNAGVVIFTDNVSIKRRTISLQGKPIGEASSAFNAPLDHTVFFDPKALFYSTPAGVRGLLVALQHTETGETFVWCQPLDSKGSPVGNATRLFTTPANDAGNGSAFGPLSVSTSISRLIWLGAFQHSSNSKGGIVKLSLTLTN